MRVSTKYVLRIKHILWEVDIRYIALMYKQAYKLYCQLDPEQQ